MKLFEINWGVVKTYQQPNKRLEYYASSGYSNRQEAARHLERFRSFYSSSPAAKRGRFEFRLFWIMTLRLSSRKRLEYRSYWLRRWIQEALPESKQQWQDIFGMRLPGITASPIVISCARGSL